MKRKLFELEVDDWKALKPNWIWSAIRNGQGEIHFGYWPSRTAHFALYSLEYDEYYGTNTALLLGPISFSLTH